MEAASARRDLREAPRPSIGIEDIRAISRALRPDDDWKQVSSRFAWFAIALEVCGVISIMVWVALS